jgi:hypothetical protein
VNRLALAFAICALAAPAPLLAQTPAPVESPTPNPYVYSDPAMSFTAPPDFYRIPIAPHDPAQFEQATVVAAWVKNPGKREQLTITITMENTEANLAGFEMTSESEVRDNVDSAFFKKHEETKLSNGMPAYWQELSIGSGFEETKRFQYVWIDGVRGVSLAITGLYGLLDEPMAKKALADSSGVLYPKYRV